VQNFVELLKAHGLKSTFQRVQILEAISICGHKDIDEIYNDVVKLHPTISLATVYKNLIIMKDNGVLCEVSVSGKKSKYEIKKEDHLHLICTHCGSIEDFTLEASFDKIVNLQDFELQKKEINLYGICTKCHSQKAS
jgi:Fe2+ or Zn2+ uptake regulation protein